MRERMKKGFTLMEMLIVATIIAVLIGVAIPTFSVSARKAQAAACAANRRSLFAQLTLEKMLTDAENLQVVANTETGKDWVAQCVCPAGGPITVTGETVSCARHPQEALSELQKEKEQLKATVESLGTQDRWPSAVRALANGDLQYRFPTVSEELMRRYCEAGGTVNGTLTWKPAVTKDGTCYLVATVDVQDQTAVENAILKDGGQSYHPSAYLIFDGTAYYMPLHTYTGKPNPTWISDNQLDLEEIRSKFGLAVLDVKN